MIRSFLIFLSILSAPILLNAQTGTVQQAELPKDAIIDVTVSDARSGKLLANEIVIFRSRANQREYQGLSDDNGKFSLRLPFGAKYDIYIMGFQDSISYNVIDIPALKPNQFYKGTFAQVDVQFEPPGSFVIEGCNFETGKAVLQPEAYVVLDQLVEYLKRKDDEKIELGGHTDNVGGAAKNLVLSQDRANAVRDYLISKGIAPERLTAKGYGLTQPIEDNRTADGRAANRRTEVKILE